MAWQRHYLEAAGTLRPWRSAIEAALLHVERRYRQVVSPTKLPDLDIVIQRVAGAGIPGFGIAGHCFRPRCITLTFDPDDMAFAAAVERGEVARLFGHELHHALRWESVGYGATLGEALVSEGMADWFEQSLLMVDEPQPWCVPVKPEAWDGTVTDAGAMLYAIDYDHPAWFFGRGRWPRWSGYAIGYALMRGYFAAVPDADPLTTDEIPARRVIDVAWPTLALGRAA